MFAKHILCCTLIATGAGCTRVVQPDHEASQTDGGAGVVTAGAPDASVNSSKGSSDATPSPSVSGAAVKYPTARVLWEGTMWRTCGPNSGVCHQNKQFPHMEYSASMLDWIGAQCNQTIDRPEFVDNLCEPPGDRLRIGAWESRIGNLRLAPADGPPKTLDITLEKAVPADLKVDGATEIYVVRKQPGGGDAKFSVPVGAWKGASGKVISLDHYWMNERALAPHPFDSYLPMLAFFMPVKYQVTGDDNQVTLGDPNGDGVFGADLGGATVKPGEPLKSYVFLRVLGPLAKGHDPRTSMLPVTGAAQQMPAANLRYWDVDDGVTALYCWIAGLKPDGSNYAADIDYARCPLSAMPPITHQGGEASTFSALYEKIFLPRCTNSGCHSGANPQSGLPLDDRRKAYDALLGLGGVHSQESPAMTYVTPNLPEKSWLMLKLSAAPPMGQRMPQGGSLPDSSIASIAEWINQGAQDN